MHLLVVAVSLVLRPIWSGNEAIVDEVLQCRWLHSGRGQRHND